MTNFYKVPEMMDRWLFTDVTAHVFITLWHVLIIDPMIFNGQCRPDLCLLEGLTMLVWSKGERHDKEESLDLQVGHWGWA